jgi:hypothetical protein
VVANIDEADLRRVEQSLAEEEANLTSITNRKTAAEHKLAMAKREMAERSKASDKLKLVRLLERLLGSGDRCYDC